MNRHDPALDHAEIRVAIGEDYPELRESVRRICAGFPGEYWRDLDDRSGYPTEFVQALTRSGFLAALIPEEHGGAGLPLRAAAVILEEINASGCTASPAHAQMYIMGTLLRHGSDEQKRRYLPAIASGELRLQAFGVTEPTTGSDTTQIKTRAVRKGDHYVVDGQKVWTSRALHPTSCCSSPAPRRRTRSGSAPKAFPCSWSTCGRPRATGSTSGRSRR
jgi:acyl-CoA dehydrogenase